MKYLENLEARLTDDQKDILKHIYEPVVVATPLSDSRRDVCVLPDGEIRAYGVLYKTTPYGGENTKIAYLSSLDCGLSWNIHYSEGKMNACTYIEKGNVYLSVANFDVTRENGLYVMRSEIGPDDPNPEIVWISDERYIDTFLPQQSLYTNRVWFTSQTNGQPKFFFSDDLGKNWKKRDIINPHCFETVFPHKGLRWSKGSGTEPIVAELSENTLMMLIRTPMDCFYKCYSYDGGDSWTEPEQTEFYGTNTTAYLLKLTDGRVLSFWNNTKPLSQPNLNKISPEDKAVTEGRGENAFTNRDAAHAAISEDGGKTFIGYREILLNPIRNNADFRYVGGAKYSMDKSVHQFQAFELPFNKVLVSVGQNVASRRLMIFDIDWLYETSRKEDFICGMNNVTSHTYVKSVSGCHYSKVGNGHCAWNRAQTAYPMPDPGGGFAEVLSVSKHHDVRMINDIGGIGWNFPLSKRGRVTVHIKIAEKQARFILSDRWYNVCDPYAAYQSPFWFDLDALDTGKGYAKVDIDFDTSGKIALVYINSEQLFKVNMTSDCKVGVSYLILQCTADGDSEGFYIKSLEKHDTN